MADRLASGETAVEMDAWSEQEWENDRQAKFEAFKMLLMRLTREAHALAVPILQAGAEVARQFLQAELKNEIARCRKFGIPFKGPSEVCHSINAAIGLFAQRASSVPQYWTHPRSLVCELVVI
jgi:hypothetical protein